MAALEKDAPRPGRPRRITAAKSKQIIDKTTKEKPTAATHWTTRTMAAAVSVSEATVRRIWQANGLKPHLARTFKVSNDPQFAEKLESIVALYLNPPEHAIVLCVDEKSQIEALDRTQPGLPLKKGRCGTMTNDYKRNGTATLFAAINTLDGTVISMCDDRHRHQEWLKFLRVIDDLTPEAREVHLIADNYATHKHPKVQRWLQRDPRFHMHCTPTSSSWLNMVERFFRDLTEKRLRRGVFHLHGSSHARIHFHPVHLPGVSQTELPCNVGIEVWWSTFGPLQTAGHAALRGLSLLHRLYARMLFVERPALGLQRHAVVH